MGQEPSIHAFGPMGTIRIMDDDRVTIQFGRATPQPPMRVWEALTHPVQLHRWFPQFDIEARAGGSVRLDFGEQGDAQGEVLVYDPPKGLQHTWVENGRRSDVRWEVKPAGEGSSVSVTHEGLSQSDGHEYAAGWHEFMDRLVVHLEGGDFAEWQERYSSMVHHYRSQLL